MPETPESVAVRWLAGACRRFLDGGEPEGLPHPERFSDDACRAIERLGAAHGVEPLLHALTASGRLDATGLPERLRKGWLAAYCLTLLTNRRRLEILQAAFAVCKERGLDLVALKGPVHVARVYRDPGLRPMVDVDLLCRRTQLGGVVEVLSALGYEARRASSVFHLDLRHRLSGEMIELHFDLYELIVGRHRFLEEVFETAIDCEPAGVRIRAPAGEHSVVVDLAHLVNHDLKIGLRQVVDFCGQLTAGTPAVDRPRLVSLLEGADLADEFATVTALFERLLDWASGRLGAGERAVREPLVAQVESQWVGLDRLAGPPLLSEMTYRASLGRKLAYLVRLLSVGGLPSGEGRVSRLSRHGGGLLRSAWRKLRRGAVVGARRAVSLKREVYERRPAASPSPGSSPRYPAG